MLYTRKGDDGTTRTFGSKKIERISKSSCQTESLGALDELNSFIGLVKIKGRDKFKSRYAFEFFSCSFG
jgi:cob(I)alamin adenosyltransferase